MGLSDRIFRRNQPDPADPASSAPAPLQGDLPPALPPAESPTVPLDATAIFAPPPAAIDRPTIIAPPPVPAEPVGSFPAVPEAEPVEVASDQPQSAGPQDLAAASVPAAAAPQRPGFRERGRLRRRLRYLRQIRELGYRDLGGLVFDQHRFERRDGQLVDAKVLAIELLDREIRSLEEVLELQTSYSELFIPGVSACARCGTLHGSDAHYCPNCGLAFSGPRSVAGVGYADPNLVHGAQQAAAPVFPPQPEAGPQG